MSTSIELNPLSAENTTKLVAALETIASSKESKIDRIYDSARISSDSVIVISTFLVGVAASLLSGISRQDLTAYTAAGGNVGEITDFFQGLTAAWIMGLISITCGGIGLLVSRKSSCDEDVNIAKNVYIILFPPLVATLFALSFVARQFIKIQVIKTYPCSNTHTHCLSRSLYHTYTHTHTNFFAVLLILLCTP